MKPVPITHEPPPYGPGTPTGFTDKQQAALYWSRHRRRQRLGVAPGPSPSPVVDWVDLWTLATGQKPSVALDFVGGQYYDGVSNAALLPSLVASATVNANGLLCNNAANNGALGALQTALRASACTVYIETGGGTAHQSLGLLGISSGAPDGILQENGDHLISWTGTTNFSGATTDWTGTVFSAVAFDGSNTRLSLLGTAAAVGAAFSSRAAATFKLGSWNNAFPFGGYMRKFAVWPVKVSDKYLQNMSYPAPCWRFPFNGMTGTSFSGANYVTCGLPLSGYFNTKSKPWTMVWEGLLGASVGTNGCILFTTVPNGLPGSGPWFGHEVWVAGTNDGKTGQLRCHIMSGWGGTGDTNNSLQVDGSTALADSKWHRIVVTYDGSGVAAGVKMWVDGVPETLTIGHNTVGANTNSGAEFEVAGQWGGFVCPFMSFFSMSKIDRGASYVASILADPKRPAVDADTLVQYEYNEGVGTTLNDKSGNGYNGTINGAGAGWI